MHQSWISVAAGRKEPPNSCGFIPKIDPSAFSIKRLSRIEAPSGATAARRSPQNHPNRPVPEHHSAHCQSSSAPETFQSYNFLRQQFFPRQDQLGFLLVLKGDRGFLVKMKSVQKALINAVITVTVGNSKGKKKGSCTYSWPVSVPCLWTS